MHVLCYLLSGIAALVFLWAYGSLIAAALRNDSRNDLHADDWRGEGGIR